MQHRAVTILFLCVFAAGMALFTQRNDFPFYYHPDEPGKVRQLVDRKRNFHHPMLLLTTADIARRAVLWDEAKNDLQRVVVVGRWVSAAFAAIAAAALAVLAARLHGMTAGCLTGALALANPLLFELAHYLKEDTAFAAGVALTALALHIYTSQPDRRNLGWLGAALALAASGKYIGFALLPVVSAIVLAAPVSERLPRRGARAGLLLGVFAGVWLLFNWWIFKSPELIWQSLGEETVKAYGNVETTRRVPDAYYAIVQQSYGGWWTPALAGVWLVSAACRFRKIPVTEWLLAGTVIVLSVVFSFTPKSSPRYYLPVSIALSYLAVAGVARVLGRPSERLPLFARRILPFAGLAVLIITLGVQWRATKLRLDSFVHDDRAVLVAWVREHLPANAVIAQDEAVNLPEPGRRREHKGREPLPQRVLAHKQVALLGSVDELRAKGVTHIAVCARAYFRHYDASRNKAVVSPSREFYDTVLHRSKKVWESPGGVINYLQPGLTLVDITSPR